MYIHTIKSDNDDEEENDKDGQKEGDSQNNRRPEFTR
jgi:hypothetical protein